MYAYSVLSISPDGEFELSPAPSYKFARAMVSIMNGCSVPGWSRFVVVEEVKQK